MVEMSTRWLGLPALLALGPVLAYLLLEGETVALLAVVNVLLITAALYTFMGPPRSRSSTS